jgi:hypothetical protein
MKLTDWQKEYRKSDEFLRTADRLKAELRDNDSSYRFSPRAESAHFNHIIEESYGDHYCCHTCRVLGVRY